MNTVVNAKRRTSLFRHSYVLMALVGLVTILSACGGSSTTTATTSTTCDKATGLTVYSAQGYDSDVTKAFQKQTGITTKLVDDSTGPLIAKISAEGNNPHWDVSWFDGNVTMQSLDDQNLLLKWQSPSTSNLTAQGLKYVPGDNSYYPVSLTTVGAIAYNKNKVPAAGLPKDWNDLLKPEYKGLVAMNDPAYSGPTYPLIAGVSQLMGSEDQGKQFFQQLKANGLINFKTNDPTLNSVETGAREFGIVQDSAIYGAIKAGQPLGIIYPSSGVIGLPGVISVSAHSKHTACAEQFVNWVLSPEGQSVMTQHDPTDGDTYFIPLVKGVTPTVQRQYTDINFIDLNVSQWAKAEAELKQWFHNNIVQ
ncbi:ABC transporter substrate-binding protein [Tengunoibacter tsumagoiensis]|uniref:ABC transporter substrate-binding protein n=1 Tax=Tengunoibacter tsumagoiensis TaxID=2014871 RepID=A0A402A820_9CHLR|nr:extracellular solute-binding protein [Tengunoibacter tsumagoiensis]GCE15229.1 ABC transporter substrate-binding protein [Tengunoibacter tsumagoiensis]